MYDVILNLKSGSKMLSSIVVIKNCIKSCLFDLWFLLAVFFVNITMWRLRNIHMYKKNASKPDKPYLLKLKKLVSEIVLERRGSFEDNRKNSIRAYKVSGTSIRRKLYADD